MSLGRLTQNGSSSRTWTPHCHSASPATAIAICHIATVARDRAGGALATLRSGSALTLDHFLTKTGPDRAIQLDERRLGAQVEKIARAVESNGVPGDDPARRSGRHHDCFIGRR